MADHQQKLTQQFVDVPQLADFVPQPTTPSPTADDSSSEEVFRTEEESEQAAEAMAYWADLQEDLTPEGTGKLGGHNKRNTEKNSMGKDYALAKDRDAMEALHSEKAKQGRHGASVADESFATFAETGVLPVDTQQDKTWMQKKKTGTPQTTQTSPPRAAAKKPVAKKPVVKKADKYQKGANDYTEDDAAKDLFG